MTKQGVPLALIAAILLAFVIAIAVPIALVKYHDYKVLAVYYELLHRQATEQQVRSRLGPPLAVVTKQDQLKRWSRGLSPQPDMRIESKVLIYPTYDFFCDPYMYMYLYINRKGILTMVNAAYP